VFATRCFFVFAGGGESVPLDATMACFRSISLFACPKNDPSGGGGLQIFRVGDILENYRIFPVG